MTSLVACCFDCDVPLGFGRTFPVYQTQLMLDRHGVWIERGRLVADAVVVCVPGLVRSSIIDVFDGMDAKWIFVRVFSRVECILHCARWQTNAPGRAEIDV